VDRLLGEYGLREDMPLARADFLRRIESRRKSEEQEEESLQAIRRGPCFGSPAFRQRMSELIEAQGSETSGQLRTENSLLRAQRIIAEELERLGWTSEQLAARRKNDPAKLAPKRTCTVTSMLPRAIRRLFPTKNSLQEYEGINHLTV
jgi:hypothetical protein